MDWGSPHDMLVRGIVAETDDSKTQQTVRLSGRHSEMFGGQIKVPVVGHYGLSYHPPKGSHCLILIPGGNPDLAVILGFEHPDHRPKDKEEGELKYYSEFGHLLFFKKDGSLELSVSGGAKIILSGTDIILDGNVKLGGADASRPLAAQGTVDTGGFADTSNLLTRVKGK